MEALESMESPRARGAPGTVTEAAAIAQTAVLAQRRAALEGTNAETSFNGGGSSGFVLAVVRRELEQMETKLAAVHRLDQKLNSVESGQGKLDRRISELGGTLAGLSEETQLQIRRGESVNSRLREMRHEFEEQLRLRLVELEGRGGEEVAQALRKLEERLTALEGSGRHRQLAAEGQGQDAAPEFLQPHLLQDAHSAQLAELRARLSMTEGSTERTESLCMNSMERLETLSGLVTTLSDSLRELQTECGALRQRVSLPAAAEDGAGAGGPDGCGGERGRSASWKAAYEQVQPAKLAKGDGLIGGVATVIREVKRLAPKVAGHDEELRGLRGLCAVLREELREARDTAAAEEALRAEALRAEVSDCCRGLEELRGGQKECEGKLEQLVHSREDGQEVLAKVEDNRSAVQDLVRQTEHIAKEVEVAMKGLGDQVGQMQGFAKEALSAKWRATELVAQAHVCAQEAQCSAKSAENQAEQMQSFAQEVLCARNDVADLAEQAQTFTQEVAIVRSDVVNNIEHAQGSLREVEAARGNVADDVNRVRGLVQQVELAEQRVLELAEERQNLGPEVAGLATRVLQLEQLLDDGPAPPEASWAEALRRPLGARVCELEGGLEELRALLHEEAPVAHQDSGKGAQHFSLEQADSITESVEQSQRAVEEVAALRAHVLHLEERLQGPRPQPAASASSEVVATPQVRRSLDKALKEVATASSSPGAEGSLCTQKSASTSVQRGGEGEEGVDAAWAVRELTCRVAAMEASFKCREEVAALLVQCKAVNEASLALGRGSSCLAPCGVHSDGSPSAASTSASVDGGSQGSPVFVDEECLDLVQRVRLGERACAQLLQQLEGKVALTSDLFHSARLHWTEPREPQFAP